MLAAVDDNHQQMASQPVVSSGLANWPILIACLGLFALASFMAEQRTKEIGIRKVMGANVRSIVFLLSKEFTKLILISVLIAIPLSIWGIYKWFSAYSYNVKIGFEVYLIAGIVALLIAWITVSYQAIRAAVSNPVNSLRNE